MNISFTGHREFDPEQLSEPLIRVIERLSASTREPLTFLSGMAMGFDMVAAEAVIEAREADHSIKLWCIIPYTDQAKFFDAENRSRHFKILEAADKVTTLQSDYTPEAFHRRNDFLVEQCDRVIAYWNGKRGSGTYYTVRIARKALIPTDNLYPGQQLSLDFSEPNNA